MFTYPLLLDVSTIKMCADMIKLLILRYFDRSACGQWRGPKGWWSPGVIGSEGWWKLRVCWGLMGDVGLGVELVGVQVSLRVQDPCNQISKRSQKSDLSIVSIWYFGCTRSADLRFQLRVMQQISP